MGKEFLIKHMVDTQELSFEDFKRRYNNFRLHFVRTDYDFGGYRTSQPFLDFQREHPDLEAQLSDDFTNAWLNEKDKVPFGLEKVMERFLPRLYEAYKLMRVFATRNEDLFQ